MKRIASFAISRPEYFALYLAGFLVVLLLTPIFRRVAISRNIWDAPNSQHKTHRAPVPYLGGVAIALGVISVTYTSILFKDRTIHNFLLATSILIPATIIGGIGLIDDLKNLSARSRFISQTLAGILISVILISTHNVGTPTGNHFFDAIITTLWVVGITNAINFFDNLDGGAAGTVGVSAAFLAVIAFAGGQFLIAGMSTVVFGAMVGFLLWNINPAQIYMGDAGSLFLGVLLSTMTVRLHPMVHGKLISFAMPILLIAIPILDTTVAVTSRIARGVSPFQGGRDHLSHRFIRMGLSRLTTATILWSLSGVFGVIALLIPRYSRDIEILLVLVGATLWVGLYIFFVLEADQ